MVVGAGLSIMYFEASSCSLVVIIPLSFAVTVVEGGVGVKEPFSLAGKFVGAGCVEVSINPLSWVEFAKSIGYRVRMKYKTLCKSCLTS